MLFNKYMQYKNILNYTKRRLTIDHIGNNILVVNVHDNNFQEKFQMDVIEKSQTRASYHHLRINSDIKRRFTPWFLPSIRNATCKKLFMHPEKNFNKFEINNT